MSVDFRSDSRSAIVDATLTNITDWNCVKVTGWYDNREAIRAGYGI